MNTAIQIARSLAGVLDAEPIPGYLVLFDGTIFMGIVPIQDWETCFDDAMKLIPYDHAAVIVLDDPPPPGAMLQAAAQSCSIIYEGAVHARPVRLLHIATPTAQSARVLP